MIVTKFIECIDRMESVDCPLLVNKAKVFSTSPVNPDLQRRLLEVFCSALTTDLKTKFDMFLHENHIEFIKCFPMLDAHMARLCQYLSTLNIERYSLEKISQRILDKWLAVQYSSLTQA